MFIGIGRYDLFIGTSASLKDKRQVLRAVTMTIKKRFAVAIAEVDFQDKWQRAALGVSCIAASTSHCRDVLDELERTISRSAADGGGEIIDRTVAILALEDLLP